jgi:hypothetical protein
MSVKKLNYEMSLGTNKISDLGNAVNAQDALSKAQFDAVAVIPYCHIRLAADYVVGTDADVKITWRVGDVVVSNALGIWNIANPSRFTVPAGYAGKYLCTFRYTLESLDAAAVSYATFRISNAGAGYNRCFGLQMLPTTTLAWTQTQISFPVQLAVGEYIEIYFTHSCGANRNLKALEAGDLYGIEFIMARISP